LLQISNKKLEVIRLNSLRSEYEVKLFVALLVVISDCDEILFFTKLLIGQHIFILVGCFDPVF